VRAESNGDRVSSVTVQDTLSGAERVLSAPYIIDATELGELLELAGIEHVVGAESQAQTGELHALPGAPEPLDQQAVTWCFAMDYLPGEDHTIEKPVDYERWRALQLDFWPGPQLGWEDVVPETLETRYRAIFTSKPSASGNDHGTFWLYRRIFNKDYYPQGLYASDITLVNWPQIDYWCIPLVGVSPAQTAAALAEARQMSLSMLYWMQTEAERHDGGYGYKGLRLRGDVMGGTPDGLAKAVYIRESRRIQAEFTVLEQHVGVAQRKAEGLNSAQVFNDSVGIGSYRIDLHPSTGRRNYVDISSYPFQIPLGALLPVRARNLLPACKNLGVTHITNGCYRLHPVEWNIGESAGALAAWCLKNGLEPKQVRADAHHLASFQHLLRELGVRLDWPDYARVSIR
jgi:hypothetical protein